MPDIVIRDILINARQESFRMQHYFLGVEHLFIGLAEIQGGLAASIIEANGYTTEYVIDLIRRQTGKGARQRLWAGMPNTPRADVVLSIANDLALEDNRSDISERDLLLAILEEGDSVPVRILKRLGFDLTDIHSKVQDASLSYAARQPGVRLEFAPACSSEQLKLTDEHLIILRRMFGNYSRARIDRRLTGGYSSAVLLVVTPIHPDGQEDAAVVVKIDEADAILDEAQRYDTHVRGSLPPLTARLEDKPTTAEVSSLAGLKYTFVAGGDSALPRDLRDVSVQLDGDRLGAWLKTVLLPNFGKTWWLQRRPFRFPVWTEYDWLLPPLLTLDHIPLEDIPHDQPNFTIRDPVRRARLAKLNFGSIVIVEDFVVQRIYRDRGVIQIALGKGSDTARRACRIEIRGVNLAQDAYYRGEIVEHIAGRIIHTRGEQLAAAVRALQPPFNPMANYLPGLDAQHPLPNPIIAFDALLDRQITGSLSKIHGDLHLGNILIGIHDSPFLIDFAQTREGHTAFDWACLEISLIRERLGPLIGENWETAWSMLKVVDAVHRRLAIALPPAIDQAVRPIAVLQDIIDTCLIRPGEREEFHAALALAALRTLTWPEMPVGCRRLMVGLAGLAIDGVLQSGRSGGQSETISSDATEMDNP